MGYSTRADDISRDLAILRSDFDRSHSLLLDSYSGGRPHFDQLSANHTNFNFNPNGLMQFRSTIVTSIPNDAQTAVNFNDVRLIGGQLTGVQWSSVLSSIIIIPGNQQQHGYFVSGIVEFAANSSGRRAAIFERQFASTAGLDGNPGGSSVGGNTMASLPNTGGVGFAVSFCLPWTVLNSEQTGQKEIELHLDVYQNSGGALNLTYATLGMTRLY